MFGSALRRGSSSGYVREDLPFPEQQVGEPAADRGAEGARARVSNGGVSTVDKDAPSSSMSPPLPVSTSAMAKGGAENEAVRRTSSKPTWFLILAAGCASMNSILLGYDIGVFGPAVSIIRVEMDLSTMQVSTAAGLSAFTAILGAIGAGIVSDRYGRTRTLILAAFLFMLGALIMSSSQGFAGLLIGRLVTGFGVGTGLAIDPLYISEISPPTYRGALVSSSEVCICIGIVMGSAVSLLVTHIDLSPEYSWRFMLGLAAVVPVSIITLACTILPETPRWLMEKQRPADALRVMRRLCSDEDEVKLTMADLQRAMQQAKAAGEATWGDMLLRPTPGSRLMLTVVIGVALFQQMSGVEVVTVYTPIILEDQAHLSESTVRKIFFGLVAWKALVVVFAAAMLDHIAGRRRLLLISCAGMCLAQTIIAIGFATDNVGASVAGLVTYVTMFSIGIGPITWLFASEVLPTHMRAKGMVLACSTNRLVAGVCLLAFLGVEGDGSAPGTGWHGFAIFAAVAFVGGLFTYFLVPETKCKTLEEMGEVFDTAARSRAWLLDRLFCFWPARKPSATHREHQDDSITGRDYMRTGVDSPAGDTGRIELVLADGNASNDAWWEDNDHATHSPTPVPTAL